MLWDEDDTPAWGTAARAGVFVVLEQPGPWGRDAARQSHLDPGLGADLDERVSAAGGRFMLMRRPGEHPDRGGPRRVLVAHAGERAGSAWLLSALVSSADKLLSLDWDALVVGDRNRVVASLPGATEAEPTLLVCTNGRRDVCCAVRGRPLAAGAATHAPDRVWEVSHTGGHRFAPTAVLLPWGQTFARLDDSLAAALLDTSLDGRVPAELLGRRHDRGRSPVAPLAQVAEAHVRAETGETSLGATWSVVDDAGLVTVHHVDGRAWRVRVERIHTGRSRPESCGKAAVDAYEYRAETHVP